MKTSICVQPSSYASDAVFAYLRGEFYSLYRITKHGEKFLVRFAACDESTLKEKWASYIQKNS